VESRTVDANGSDERLRRLVELLAERNAQLEHALRSRVLIEQAKGVLAERWDITPAEAFQALRSAARSERVRVHDLAGRVLEAKTTPRELERLAPR
jgi:AmiR/NasT family two-component response regulator